jgi:hypothetical protein
MHVDGRQLKAYRIGLAFRRSQSDTDVLMAGAVYAPICYYTTITLQDEAT